MPVFAIQKIVDRAVAKQHSDEVATIDLVGIANGNGEQLAKYDGICW